MVVKMQNSLKNRIIIYMKTRNIFPVLILAFCRTTFKIFLTTLPTAENITITIPNPVNGVRKCFKTN